MITINALSRKNSSTISIKRKNLLLLTSLLLAHTTSVWAMNANDWNDNDKAAIWAAGKGQQDFEVKRREFIPFIPPAVYALKPIDPLPDFWGDAQQKVECKFANGVEVGDIILPTQHPLNGQWVHQHDQERALTLATLKLTTFLNNQHWAVYEREVRIQHDPVSQGEEVLGKCCFSEDTVFRARTLRQRWKNPMTGAEYNIDEEVANADVDHHQGYRVIYVEPFALGGPSKPKDEYRGKYDFKRILNNNEELKNKERENLLYSDGNDIYLPHVTQELWEQGASQTGFFIASIKRDRRLNFVAAPLIQGGQLQEGLYQLLSVQEGSQRRTEKWQKLGEDQTIIEIRPRAGLSSIPGLGGYAPRVVPQAEGEAENFNRYLANYMETATYQRIINTCIQKIDTCTVAVGTLRTELKHLIEMLQQLPTESETSFVNGLKNIINVDEINNIIENTENEIAFNVGSWKSALINKITEKFKNLTDDPTVEFVEATGVLTLTGALIGMEDINKALQQKPTARELNIFALNTFFFDADLTKPGLSVSFIAPEWKINAPVTINLSGASGENGSDGHIPGEHGKPGHCGNNGGHFFGLADIIQQIHHLTVNTSGGKGGPGGKGAKGADGLDGADAKLTDEDIRTKNIQPTRQLFDQKKVENINTKRISEKKGKSHKKKEKSSQTTREILFTKNFYKVSGQSGAAGKDGGQGGKGGLAGKPGEILMNIPLTPEKAISEPGGKGSDGEAGLGGKNGTHGKNGEWSKEVEGKYEHNFQAKGSDSKSKIEFGRKRMMSVADGKLKSEGYTAQNTSDPVASGKQPITLNEAGLEQPTPQVRLDSDPLVQAYNLYYQQQASNPDVAPIIKVFPNLQ